MQFAEFCGASAPGKPSCPLPSQVSSARHCLPPVSCRAATGLLSVTLSVSLHCLESHVSGVRQHTLPGLVTSQLDFGSVWSENRALVVPIFQSPLGLVDDPA